jgi:hypothetical protein
MLYHLLISLYPQISVFNRKHQFDPAEEIARHPISAAGKNLWLTGILEIENAAVFEEPIHDAAHRNVVAQTLQLGAQTTNPAHDQIDFHTG